MKSSILNFFVAILVIWFALAAEQPQTVYLKYLKCNVSAAYVHENFSCSAKSYNRSYSTGTVVITSKIPIDNFYVSSYKRWDSKAILVFSVRSCPSLQVWNNLSRSSSHETLWLVRSDEEEICNEYSCKICHRYNARKCPINDPPLPLQRDQHYQDFRENINYTLCFPIWWLQMHLIDWGLKRTTSWYDFCGFISQLNE